MRILMMLGFSNPFPGAAWSRIGYLAVAASKKGHSVEVLGSVIRSSFSLRGVSEYNQVRVLNLIPSAHLNDPIIFFFNSAMSFAISLIVLLCRRPDVAVVSLPPGHAGLGVLVACRMLGIRYVIDYRDEWEVYGASLSKSRIGRTFHAIVSCFAVWLYSGGQLVATTPNHVASLNRRGLPSVRLLPNGADLSTFKFRSEHNQRQKMGYSDKDFVLVYSGTLEQYYRLDTVVRAMDKVRLNFGVETKLLVVGKGIGLSALLSTANQLGLEHDITWAGIKENKEELAHILSSADVGLIPYDDNPLWINTLPAKFFEYCATGLPILATTPDDSLLATYVRTYQIGMVSPPMDQYKLAENIYWIYCNASFRAEASKRARTLMELRFDSSKIAEEYLGLLQRMLDRATSHKIR